MAIDTKGFNSSLNEITKSLDNLKSKLSSFNLLESATNIKGVENAKNEIKGLGNELGNLAKKNTTTDINGNIIKQVNLYKDSFAQMTQITSSGIKTTVEDFSKLENKIEQLQGRLDKSKNNSLINPSVLDDLQNRLNKINTNTSEKEIKELQNAINNLSSNDSGIVRLQNSINSLQNNLKNTRGKYGSLIDLNDLKNTTNQINNLKAVLNDAMNGNHISSAKITSEINKANNSLKTMATNARTNSAAIRTASQDSQSFASAIQRAFSNTGIFLTTATAIRTVTNEIKQASQYIIELDERLTNIQMITGRSATAVKSITNEFKELGATLHTTNLELMAGAEEVLRAGYDTTTAKEMMEASILGAKISGQTTEQVTQQLIAIKNAFNLEGSSMNNVVDIISKMDNTSATSFSEIAEAIQRTAYSAQQAGTPLENLVSYITTVSEKTRRSAETIGESFKSIYSRYSNIKLGNLDDEGKSINDVETALARVDIKLRDSAESFREFDDVLVEYADKYNKGLVSQVDHLAVVNTLAGTRQKETLLALIENFDAVTKHQNDMVEATGSAKQKFDEVYSDSLKAKISDLQRNFEKLYESILKSGALGSSIDGFSGFINGISSVINTFGAMPSTIATVVGALTMFNSKFKESVSTMTSFVPVVGDWQSKLMNIKQSLTKQTAALKASITNLKAYNNAVVTGAEGMGRFGPPIANAGNSLLILNGKLALATAGMIACEVATMALQTALSMGLSLLITGMISGLTKLVDNMITTKEEARELADELRNSIQNSAKSAAEAESVLTKIKEAEGRLNNASNEEAKIKAQQELNDLRKEMATILPETVTMLNEEGDAISTSNGLIQQQIDLKKEQMKTDAELLLKSNGSVKGQIDNLKKINETLEKMNLAKAQGKDVYTTTQTSKNGYGEATTVEIGVKFSEKDKSKLLQDAEGYSKQLQESFSAVQVLKDAGYTDDYIKDVLGIDIFALREYIDELNKATEEQKDMSDSSEELNKSLEETENILTDLNYDGVVDATDAMLALAEATDQGKSAVENLGNQFSALQGHIDLLNQMKEEFSEYGILDTSTVAKVLNTGDAQLVALLGDEANMLQNINSLLETKAYNQEQIYQHAIRRANEEIRASNLIVDGLSVEEQAIRSLVQTKSNVFTQSANERINLESEVVNSNLANYNADNSNQIATENSKIRGSFTSASQRINNEKEVVDKNLANYKTEDKNFVSLANSKIKSADAVANAAIQGTAEMVSINNSNYAIDAANYASYINSKIESYRAFALAQNGGFTLGSLGLKNEINALKEYKNEYDSMVDKITTSMNNTQSTYGGSGGISGGVSHGSLGTGTSGSGGTGGKSEAQKAEEAYQKERERLEKEANSAISSQRDKLVNALKKKYESLRDKELAVYDKEIEMKQKELDRLRNGYVDEQEKILKLEKELAMWEKNDSARGQEMVAELKQQLAEAKLEKEINDLEAQKEQVNKKYDAMLDDKKLYEEANNMIINKSYQTQLDLLKEFGDGFKDTMLMVGKTISQVIQEEIEYALEGLKYIKGQGNNFENISKNRSIASYDTGGYTPSNISRSGALAILHDNERILNKVETQYFKSFMDDTVPKINTLVNAMGNVNDNLSTQNITNNGDVIFSPTFNVTNKTEFDAKNFEFNIEKGIRKELRKLGRRV